MMPGIDSISILWDAVTSWYLSNLNPSVTNRKQNWKRNG